MGPVYAIAYNGALADLKQQFPDDESMARRVLLLAC